MFQAFGQSKLAGTPISASLKEWRSHIKRFSPRTQEHYTMVLRRFGESLDITVLEELRPQQIEKYINFLLSKGVKNRTCNAHLTAIKSFCGWLAQNYSVPNIGVGFLMLAEDPPKQRVLTSEEYQKVLAVCKPYEADMIKFLGHTGLRVTEAVSLTWGCFDPPLTKITLTGKGRRRRTVPLNDTCREILKKYPRGTPETHLNFLKSDRKCLYWQCQTLASKAHIRPFGPHALRHFFCTELTKQNVPMAKVSKIMGHSSIRTTEKIYMHLTESDLLHTTDCLD